MWAFIIDNDYDAVTGDYDTLADAMADATATSTDRKGLETMDYITCVTTAHKRMDMALSAPIGSVVQRYNARYAMSAAQSARARANSAGERAECADLIHEAERVLG